MTHHALFVVANAIGDGAVARSKWDHEGARAEFAVDWAMHACMEAYTIAWIDQATPIQD